MTIAEKISLHSTTRLLPQYAYRVIMIQMMLFLTKIETIAFACSFTTVFSLTQSMSPKLPGHNPGEKVSLQTVELHSQRIHHAQAVDIVDQRPIGNTLG